MVSIVHLIRPEIAFDPQTISVLSAALDEAWDRLLQSGRRNGAPRIKKSLWRVRFVFLLRTIDLKRKASKLLRKRLSRRRGFSRAANKVSRYRNGLLEVLHPRENIGWPIWLRNKKAARRQIAPAWRREAGNDD